MVVELDLSSSHSNNPCTMPYKHGAGIAIDIPLITRLEFTPPQTLNQGSHAFITIREMTSHIGTNKDFLRS